MPESDRAFTYTVIHLCDSIFHHYLHMHLMKVKLSFCLLQASPRVLLGLKYFENFFIGNFFRKRVDFAFAASAFEIGHTLDNINLRIKCPLMQPNCISLESDPVWVRIADPNGFGSVEARVNASPIRYSLGTDPFGSDLVQTGPKANFASLEPTKSVYFF